MGAYENKQSAEDAYAAFGKGDAEGAMRNIDDSVEYPSYRSLWSSLQRP